MNYEGFDDNSGGGGFLCVVVSGRVDQGRYTLQVV